MLRGPTGGVAEAVRAVAYGGAHGSRLGLEFASEGLHRRGYKGSGAGRRVAQNGIFVWIDKGINSCYLVKVKYTPSPC
jgi:hypothetical protein